MGGAWFGHRLGRRAHRTAEQTAAVIELKRRFEDDEIRYHPIDLVWPASHLDALRLLALATGHRRIKTLTADISREVLQMRQRGKLPALDSEDWKELFRLRDELEAVARSEVEKILSEPTRRRTAWNFLVGE